jgi:hypothetical protein
MTCYNVQNKGFSKYESLAKFGVGFIGIGNNTSYQICIPKSRLNILIITMHIMAPALFVLYTDVKKKDLSGSYNFFNSLACLSSFI